MIDSRTKSIMPVDTWLTKGDAYIGLLLSSFIINIMGLVFPICVLQFYDRVIPQKTTSTMIAMICLILGALAFETIFKILRAYVSSWASARFTYNMGIKLYTKLIYTDLSAFEKNTAGVYLDKFNSAESLREYYCGQNLIMLVDIPFVAVYLILMFMINRYMVIMPSLVIMIMVIQAVLEGNKTFTQLEHKTNVTEAKSKFLIETIGGIHTIKALGMEEQFLRRYERLHKSEILSNYELIQRLSQSSRSGNLFSQLASILAITLGGILVMYHELSVGGLAASILLIGKIMQPVTKLVAYLERKQNIEIANRDLTYLMGFKPEYNENARTLDNFRGEVELRNVAFKYPTTDQTVFEGLNLHVMSNETIVIHGDAFSGKTTVLLLMSGIFKASEGQVYIDGVDINDLNLEELRKKIGFMPDSGELFDGTIMDNLTMFESDKYVEQAIEIAKAIGLHDIIESMPNSYNTQVGSGTVDLLSKGNKQQILMARALIGDPRIILFDEANVSLDIDADIKLRKYLLAKKGKCTIILVTHRPSLLEMADKHYKIENGKLVEFKWK